MTLLPPHDLRASRKNTQGGFALVIALSLMAFILVLVLSLSTLLQVETSAAKTQLSTLGARQNALLGLQVALGELQVAAGPDQRSVARADVMHRRASTTAPATFPAQFDSDNNADTRTYWVGVSHSDGTTNLKPNEPVTWLVSGLADNLNSAGQLADELDDPVDMITVRENAVPANSPVETTLRAGKVFVRDTSAPDSENAAFAWIIDDESQKAKLAPADPAVDNRAVEDNERLFRRRTVLPGLFDISEIAQSDEGQTINFGGEDVDTIFQVSRLEELEIFAQSNREVANDRRFDYTLSGYGVLVDTRNGRLKRDLTAAYESATVFDDLFTERTEAPYITMDPDKLSASSDLQTNGYIHHGIFRDYYQLKDRVNASGTIGISLINKDLTYRDAPDETRFGNVGPHDFSVTVGGGSERYPYGEFEVRWSDENPESGPGSNAHNPITPSLSFLQQNAWLEWTSINPAQPRYRQHAQMFFGIYNPYNVTLELEGRANQGPLIFGYPMPIMNMFDGGSSTVWSQRYDDQDRRRGRSVNNSFQNDRWIWARDARLIPPGKSQIFGFASNVNDVGQVRRDRSTLSHEMGDAVFSAARNNRFFHVDNSPVNPADPFGSSPADIDFLAEFSFLSSGYNPGGRGHGPNLGWGLPWDERNPGGAGFNTVGDRHEVAQIFYFPFFADDLNDSGNKGQLGRKFEQTSTTGSPGVEILRRQPLTWPPTSAQSDEQAIFQFKLRTTVEPGPLRLRPLIDGNIRALWNNPKWDSIENLDAIATHSYADNRNGGLDAFPELDSPDANSYLTTGDGGSSTFQTVLFDIPREPLVSLGQLQHASAGRFSYEPSYIVGNSYANIRIPLNDWVGIGTDEYSGDFGGTGTYGINGNFNLYDASYLVNEALFDTYTFTTIPFTSSQEDLNNYLDQTDLLPNPRYRPYEPIGLSLTTANLQSETAGRSNAGFLLVDGAFNVNSTSVEAWEVFLSGTKGLPFRKLNEDGSVGSFETVDGVRFPRVQTIRGEPWESAPDSDSWFGFRELTTPEVRELASAIAERVRERGPFHNLSEFVNRALTNDETGRSGVLQAALDAVINDDLGGTFEDDADRGGELSNIAENSTQGAGFPTQLLQGDLLQALAPYMQTRSDTFKIRSYGEVTDPFSGDVRQVWCEAVVQRLPDPVQVSGGTGALNELIAPSSPFGRKFEVLSIRWLNEDDV